MLLPRLQKYRKNEFRARKGWNRRRWLLRAVLASAGALGLVAGLAAAHPPLAVAPPIETSDPQAPQLSAVRSLEELYVLRDRLRAALETAPESLPALQAIEIRIQVEETAEEKWEQALNVAGEAQALAAQADIQGDATAETAGKVEALWRQAVNALSAVPEGSFLSPTAAAKLAEYQPYLNAAAYRYDTARSDFLIPIAERTGLPLESVHITVCRLDGECRRLNGDVPPASPASLIKVPIAVALMQKVADENLDLNQKILVEQGNYTEDASKIWVGEEYPLRRIVKEMIDQSSNIATNQLIDFLGRDYINQVMRDRGYTVTTVNTKLVGDQIYPADLGVGPNDISMDELTEMMRQIYRQERPGDRFLIEDLASQYDLVLGHAGLRSTPAIWLGEKTGQNSDVLGTTLAMKIKDQQYAISVAIDYSGNEQAIRHTVRDVANHIAQSEEF